MATATDVGAIRAKMELDATGFNQELQKAKQSLSASAAEAQRVNKDMKLVARSLYDLGLSGKEVRKIQDEFRNMRPDVLEQQIKNLEVQLRRLGATDDQIARIKAKMTEVKDETDRAESRVEAFHSALVALGATTLLRGLISTVKSLANEAQNMAMSYQGLIELSKSLNVNVQESTGLVQELADKGFMSVSQAAEAVKTALASGLNLEQTRKLILALGDAAAYNRQANYGWGEAVVVTLQGIKQGNSTLTDAVGVTTNLSVMYDRYAKSIGTTAGKLTDAQKIQAAYNGFIQDASLYAGNAATAMEGYTGSQAHFNQTMQTARAELGESFLPILQEIMDTLAPLIKEFAEWASNNKGMIAGLTAATVTVTGLIAVLTTLITVIAAVKAAFASLEISMGPIGWAITGISLVAAGVLAYKSAADATAESIWKFAQNQEELNKKLSESPLSRSVDDVNNLQNQIDTLNQKLKEQKDLQDQISKLTDERNQLVISNGSNGEIFKLDRQIGELQGNLKEVDKQLSQLGIKTPDDAAKRLQEMNDQLKASVPALIEIEKANLKDAAAQVQHIDKVNQLTKQYDKLSAQTKLTSADKEQLRSVVEQLVQEYPSLDAALDQEGQWHIKNRGLIDDLIDAERNSVKEASDASAGRVEVMRKETEAKIELLTQQMKALDAVNNASSMNVNQPKQGTFAGQLGVGGDAWDAWSSVSSTKSAATAAQKAIQDQINQSRLAINEMDKLLASVKEGKWDDFLSTPASSTSDGSSSNTILTSKGKSIADVQQEQYQAALKYLDYKKNLNQVSEKDEMAYLNRLQRRYKNNADIRQDLEVKVYQLQQQISKESFAASQEWIDQEERRMTLAGQSEDQITQMKLDAWTRVRNRYEKDSDYYKQADTQIYNLKVSLIKSTQKAQEDAMKQQEQDASDLLKSTTDAIKKQKQAQLDAIDEQRKAIEAYYNAQQSLIDQGERERQRQALLAEKEKYQNATSEAGKKHLQELDEQLRQMDIEDQKDALDKERDQKLSALDRQKDDVESWYNDLEDILSGYKGDAIKIYQLLEDERFKAFKSTNDNIRSELTKLAADYALIMSGASASASASGSVSQELPNNAIGSAASQASAKMATIAQMQANSSAWWNASAAERKALEAANEQLGASIGAMKNNATGKWVDASGKPLFHTGRDGMTGLNFRSSDQLMPDEITAILRDNEYVFTPEQLKSLVGSPVGGSTIHIEKIIEVNDPVFEDGIDVRTLGRDAGDTAADIIRKNLTGGG